MQVCEYETNCTALQVQDPETWCLAACNCGSPTTTLSLTTTNIPVADSDATLSLGQLTMPNSQITGTYANPTKVSLQGPFPALSNVFDASTLSLDSAAEYFAATDGPNLLLFTSDLTMTSINQNGFVSTYDELQFDSLHGLSANKVAYVILSGPFPDSTPALSNSVLYALYGHVNNKGLLYPVDADLNLGAQPVSFTQATPTFQVKLALSFAASTPQFQVSVDVSLANASLAVHFPTQVPKRRDTLTITEGAAFVNDTYTVTGIGHGTITATRPSGATIHILVRNGYAYQLQLYGSSRRTCLLGRYSISRQCPGVC